MAFAQYVDQNSTSMLDFELLISVDTSAGIQRADGSDTLPSWAFNITFFDESQCVFVGCYGGTLHPDMQESEVFSGFRDSNSAELFGFHRVLL